MATKKIVTKVIKSAETGKFVSKEFANKHPKTTFEQKVTKPRKVR
jgi:hypothetical protein